MLLTAASLAVGLGGGSVPAPVARHGVLRIERVRSRARGRAVDLLFGLPALAPPAGMPMVLLLHGLGGSARNAAPPGLLSHLSHAVAHGAVPPFGFVAVDGGDSYWHEHHRGDDPLTMLLDEVPGWLRLRGLADPDGRPFACAGISMGGFGALLYARRRSERRAPVDAVGVIAPALMPWEQMRKRRVFHSRVEWASMDPLHNVGATKNVPTALWCGTNDLFVEGARAFARRARPELVRLAPGGHDAEFFAKTVPELTTFLGGRLPRCGHRPLRHGRGV